MARRGADAVIRWLARILTAGFFRSVEVHGDVGPAGRPTLVVANHFNGFVDPVVLARALPRVPRFLAKATLWDVLPARPFLALAGVIPVHRQEDDPDTSGNASTFRTCHAALAEGETVAVFPEGTTHDRPHLARIRTGAARIALGAAAEGIEGLRVVPVGLTFEDKIALRSRVLVRVGPAIEVPPGGPGEDDHEAVRRLTDRIEARLRTVAPDYRDRHEQGALDLAAAIALRSEGSRRTQAVAMDAREDLASRLDRLPGDRREEVIRSVADYHLDLALLGVDDGTLVAHARPGRLVARFLPRLVAVVLLGVVALGAVLVNVLPYLAVRLAGNRVDAPVSKGTVRLLVALVAFPLAWGTAAWASVGFGWDWLLVAVGFALAGFLAVWLLEQAADAGREIAGWRRLGQRRGFAGPVLEHRERFVAGVLEAAAAVD